MNIKLSIENKLVDLPLGENITLQKNSNVLGSVDKILTSRSFTITCPFTITNKDIFKHLELPSMTDTFLTTFKVATLEVEGVFIFKGKAVLLSIGKDGYEIALTFGELTSLSELVSEKRKIYDLGFTEIWQDWTRTAVYTPTKEDYGIYPYITGLDPAIPSSRMRSPAISIQFLIEQLSTLYDISFTFNDTITDDYLLLTGVRNIKNSLANQIDVDRTHIGYKNPNNMSPSVVPLAIPDYEGLGSTAYGIKVFDTSKFTTLNLLCYGEFRPFPQVALLIQYNANGDVINTTSFTAGTTQLFNINAEDISPGDWFVVGSTAGGADYSITATVTLNVGEDYPLSDTLEYLTPEGDYTDMLFPLFANCDFTALELLKHIQITHGLFATQGVAENEFIFEILDILNDRLDIQDKTNNFISLEKSEFSFESWAKINKFMYSLTSEYLGEDYNSAEFLLDYFSLPDENIIKTVFGTAENTVPLGIRQFELVDGDVENNDLLTIYCQLNASFQLVAVPFETILAEKYSVLIDKLENMRVCTINLNLNQLQYKEFDMNKIMYLKQIGKYFYPITGDYDCESEIFVLKAFMV